MSYQLPSIYNKPPIKGMHAPLVDTFDRAVAGLNAAWTTAMMPWMCARCGERALHDKDGYRKNRGKPAWVHLRSANPWCASDKQHGPKTRRILPVPSLMVIEEMEL